MKARIRIRAFISMMGLMVDIIDKQARPGMPWTRLY